MVKRRLTHRQMSRQKAQQAKRVARAKPFEETVKSTLNQSLGPEQPGVLVAHYGTTLIVENQVGQCFSCSVRQNLGTLVTGDEVIWQQIDDKTGIVVACFERRSTISRPDKRTSKPIVANVDVIVIVCAPVPAPGKTTLDRYLILAQSLQLPALIIINKSDLASTKTHKDLLEQAAVYRQLGYPCLEVSSKTNSGVLALEQALAGKTAVLMGQSGVGKSSLLNALAPHALAQTQSLSALSSRGRQTTSASRLYHLPLGANLIDSPGIHEFSLSHFSKEAIKQGFREFIPYLGHCRFRNCAHINEPGCALQEAVRLGKIAPFRLQSYHIIVGDLDNK
ncbi:MAG: small ribosomal subunit biogenesis GTPase RsgA [Proteobacteria bacterium]|nr:small ribosomal subunit biogenesis GTPase RsgA [Pseudomonadota bacterium]